jgi:hypothetical protein
MPHRARRRIASGTTRENFMRYLMAAICGLLFCLPQALADPVGRYDVDGTNPGGGSRYEGTVAVEKTGQTYRVVWDVDGTRYVGTGIGDDKFIAVSYSSGNSTGLALYGHDANGIWVGIWTYANGREIGSERWIPR